MEKRKGKKARKKVWLIVLLVLLVVVIGAVVAIAIFYHSRPFSGEEHYGSGQSALTTSYQTPDPIKDKVMNVLLCGTDYDSEEKGRTEKLTDVMIVVNYDIARQKVNALQIPRDTYVDNKYHTGGKNKMNGIHNNPKGGLNSLIEAINDNFKLPIDHFVTIGMDDFRHIVDALGGVEVDSPKAFTSIEGIRFSKGRQTLNGKEAEAFVRERKAFSNADVQRQKNQRAFLAGLMDRLLDAGMGDIYNLMPVLAKNVKTDMTIGEMISLAFSAQKLDKSNILFHTPPGHNLRYRAADGSRPWVYGMNKKATAEMLNQYFRPYSEPVPAEELGIIQITDIISIKDEAQPLGKTGSASSFIQGGTQ